MSIDLQFGEPALFAVSDRGTIPDNLSVRERRLLVGALNFHALMAPARTLRINAYDGGPLDLPRTTDDSTFTGRSRLYRKRLWSAKITSHVGAEQRAPIDAERSARRLDADDTRHIHISRDEALAFDPPRDVSPDPVRRVLRAIRARTPLLYDQVRDIELLRHRTPLVSAVDRRDYQRDFQPGGIHADSALTLQADAPEGAPKAVIVGMHWFELGGAERWAFETVRLVREAGFLPIVMTHRDSHHPFIDRPELDGALLLPFSEHVAQSQTPGVEQLLRALLRTFDVRGVVVHHNQWLYDRLHWIRESRPDIPIIDSTHIVEYRGGGYPVSSALVETALTKHHVISPALERWMTDVQGVPSAKVVMAPLLGLTAESSEAEFRAHAADEPITIAFVGRMARQKAPEVFIEAAARAHRVDPSLRFIMHGDGELAGWADALIARAGLDGVLERRDSSVPVSETYAQSHLLVITAHNEGLTLTTLEAIAAGVPVVSTDVGSQRDIVPARALMSRNPYSAARRAAELMLDTARDDAQREGLWKDEREAERKLLNAQTATAWFMEEVAAW